MFVLRHVIAECLLKLKWVEAVDTVEAFELGEDRLIKFEFVGTDDASGCLGDQYLGAL